MASRIIDYLRLRVSMAWHASAVLALFMLVIWLGAASPLAYANPGACTTNESFRTGASASLPDCRVYEQVSPVEKGGYPAYSTKEGLVPVQVSPSGNAIAYLSYGAFPNAQGNTALFAGHLAKRGADSGPWQNEELSPPAFKASKTGGYRVSYFFTSDLSQAILQVPFDLLTPEATPGVFNLYVRSGDGSYTWVNSATPATPVSSLCPAVFEEAFCAEGADVSAYAGASSDFSHILFESTAELTPEAPPGASVSNEILYEKFAGNVHLAGILPDGFPAPKSTLGAGSNAHYESASQAIDGRLEHAVSSDGSHVIFEAPAEGEPDPAQKGKIEVYDRIKGEETIELSAPAAGSAPAVTTPEASQFWTASADGSRVFFTSSAELTTQSNTGTSNTGSDLYEYNFISKELTDLTIDTNPVDALTGPHVLGVIGAADDGSYIYFVAEGQLAAGKGEDGKPNLYMVHNGGTPVYIATLAPGDSDDWTERPAMLTAYVTPDGRHMTFMSTNSLTGFNNIDKNTAKPDSEVFEYSSAPKEGEIGTLVCGSCDADGTRPIGSAEIGGIKLNTLGQEQGISTPFYRVRALSDNGSRLFFTSPDPLATGSQFVGTPSASRKVYEYEHEGEGSCTNDGGCTFLISKPDNTEQDIFLGASTSGGDVFFATTSRLTSLDQDNLVDIYDAQADSGVLTPRVEPSCQGDCRSAGLSMAIPSLVTGFTGDSGNVVSISTSISIGPKAITKCSKNKRLSRGHCVKFKRKKRKSKQATKAGKIGGNRRSGR